MKQYIDELKDLQQKYFKILKDWSVKGYNPTYLIDLCTFFWENNIDSTKRILNELTKENTCYILSGNIGLEFDANQHFFFTTMGDKHILDAPICRFKPEKPHDDIFAKLHTDATIHRMVSDLIKVYENLNEAFIVLPISLMNDIDMDAFYDIYWSIMSAALDEEMHNVEDLRICFDTIEDIQERLSLKYLLSFIFNDINDEHRSLKERLIIFSGNHQEFIMDLEDDDYIGIFHIATNIYLLRVLVILAQCYEQRMIPYIDMPSVYKYIWILGSFYKNNIFLNSMAKCIIINYNFATLFSKDMFLNVDFNTYHKNCREYDLLGKILKTGNSNNAFIPLKRNMLQDIIFNEFNEFINVSNINILPKRGR